MRNLILIPIIFILLAACKKEEKEEPIITTLKGKWISAGHNWISDNAIKSTDVVEFGDNTYESVFNEKMVTLPDCTLVYKFKRIVKSDYSVHKHFIRFTNMRSDTNGVAEYSGKTEYWMPSIGYGILNLNKAETWHQLSGKNSQLKDGLFYQLDSSRSIQQDTIKYHHHKLRFGADIVDYHYLTNGTRKMPDENANWELKCYETELSDSTFVCGSKVYYQFIDGKMISFGRRGDHEQQRTYISYAKHLSLI